MRRLGYLLEHVGHVRQTEALAPLVKKAKATLSLDPSATPVIQSLAELQENDAKWKLVIHDPLEIDS